MIIQIKSTRIVKNQFSLSQQPNLNLNPNSSLSGYLKFFLKIWIMFPMLANRKQEEENKHLTGRQLNSNERTTTEHQTDRQTNKQTSDQSVEQTGRHWTRGNLASWNVDRNHYHSEYCEAQIRCLKQNSGCLLWTSLRGNFKRLKWHTQAICNKWSKHANIHECINCNNGPSLNLICDLKKLAEYWTVWIVRSWLQILDRSTTMMMVIQLFVCWHHYSNR